MILSWALANSWFADPDLSFVIAGLILSALLVFKLANRINAFSVNQYFVRLTGFVAQRFARLTQPVVMALATLAAAALMVVATLSAAQADPFERKGVFRSGADVVLKRTSGAQDSQAPKFLPVDQAFSVLGARCAPPNTDQLCLDFSVTPGHYLYQDKVDLLSGSKKLPIKLNFSRAPIYVDDPLFGPTPVFYQDVTAQAPLSSLSAKAIKQLNIRWQGCAEAGLCYPPVTEPLEISDLPVSAKQAQSVKPSADNADVLSIDAADPSVEVSSSSDGVSVLDEAELLQPVNAEPQTSINQDALQNTDPFGLSSRPLLGLLLLFIAGLGLAFTPCVLPMLPIVASIVATQHHKTRRGLLLTLSYGFGVALAYGLIGALVGYLGHAFLIQSLQNPVVLGALAVLFALLGLYLFGVISLGRLGQKLFQGASRLSALGERHLGGYLGSAIAGFLSALVVSPCVSAPLAAALLSIAAVGSPSFGFVGLFVLGLGLSIPLVAFGALETRLLSMGKFTDWIKQGFALSMFAMSLVVLARIVSPEWMLLLWALFALALSVWLFSHKSIITRVLAALMVLVSLLWLVGFFTGSASVLKPWDQLTQSGQPVAAELKTTSVSEAIAAARMAPAAVVVLSAEWCIECRRLEAQTLTPWPGNWLTHIELDITDLNPEQQQFLTQNQLFGPPAILYFSRGELVGLDQGWISRDDFIARLKPLSP